ncbi:MAG: hypothetical protein AB7K71_02230 [Polyangiaceae bacterium]
MTRWKPAAGALLTALIWASGCSDSTDVSASKDAGATGGQAGTASSAGSSGVGGEGTASGGVGAASGAGGQPAGGAAGNAGASGAAGVGGASGGTGGATGGATSVCRAPDFCVGPASGASPEELSSIGPQDLTSAAAVRICAALERCCDASSVERYFAPYVGNDLLKSFHASLPPAAAFSPSECPALLEQMLDVTPFGDWVASVVAGQVTFRESEALGCLNALGGASCGDAVQQALSDSSCFGFGAPAGGAEQRKMFQRTLGSGASCSPIRDGVGSSFYGQCDPRSFFCCYVDPMSTSAGCTYPFTADGSPRNGTCQPAAADGAQCQLFQPLKLCATGSSCDSATDTCRAEVHTPLAVGERCADAQFNLLGDCEASYCDLGGSNRCEALTPLGEACGFAYECASGNCY